MMQILRIHAGSSNSNSYANLEHNDVDGNLPFCKNKSAQHWVNETRISEFRTNKYSQSWKHKDAIFSEETPQKTKKQADEQGSTIWEVLLS